MDIHVLHVLNSAHGGSALSTFELIEALKNRGVKSSLVCFNNASPEQEKSISNLVEGRVLFIPLYWMNKKIRTAWWKRPIIEGLSLWRTGRGHKHQDKILTLIKKEGVNIVHTSTILNPEGAIVAKKNGLPHVWHVRELIGPGMHFQFPYFYSWIQFVTRHSDYLIANSFVTLNKLQFFFEPTKLLAIPNGIRLDRFSVKEHREGNPIVIGMVGNVTSRLKNHEFFIQTVRLLGKNGFEFRIYGALPTADDPYYEHLQKNVQESGLKNILLFKGHYENPDEIMSEIDILFHPTSNESFGRIFIEAMASGIPIVAVNEGGALEMVKDGINGFLVNADDTKLASLKINQLAESPELRNIMGRSGRSLVEQRYSVDKLGDEMVMVYKRVLAERNKSVQ